MAEDYRDIAWPHTSSSQNAGAKRRAIAGLASGFDEGFRFGRIVLEPWKIMNKPGTA